VDVIYISMMMDGYGFIVFTRDDLSDWIEVYTLKNNISLKVDIFLYEDIIYRYDLSQKFIMDNDPENQDIIKSLLEYYNIKNINISVYHP
jgi:hypothetical protein